MNDLLTPAATVGAPEYIFLVAQVIVGLVGAYLSLVHADTHPVRAAALKRLGQALLVVGLLGAVVGALRTGGVDPFRLPIWITAATVLNVALVAFALYYAQAVYPKLLAAHEQASKSRGGARSAARPQSGQPRLQVPPPPRPKSEAAAPPVVTNGTPRPTSGRREARRDRKRKSR